MPLTLNPLEYLAFRTLNQAPAVTLDMWGAPASCIVLAALRMNLFATIGTGAMTTTELSRTLKTDPHGTELWCDTLVKLGYLKKSADRYETSTMTRKWLLDSGDINFTPFYLYWGELMERFFPKLEESLRTGKPPVNLYHWLESDDPDAAIVSRHFQEGMIAIAKFVANDIAAQLPIPANGGKVLDIGGGHGEYTIALCRKYPQATALIFDGAQALATGNAAIAAAGLQSRIQTQVGNFITDDLPTGFDVALLFNIVHGFTPAENIDLFRKVKGALNPGGQLVVLEQIHGTSPLPVMDGVTHILGMAYYHLLGGQVYTYEDIQGWLTTAGFGDIRRKSILQANSALIMGSL
jgi:ubiquinone/menaquinone biosynthesis C-methylase UbiE